mmetsp:Transcript_30998/g.90668  ORF Transcript_30998/g.90668 Transcript_30998/m.90668 type:complete len:133 (+) Transcript_30998:118-516(+)
MASDEDIFASLGGSLMSGLLSDLHQTTSGRPSGNTNPNANNSGHDDDDALASLERDLAGLTAGGGGGGQQPPGILGGMTTTMTMQQQQPQPRPNAYANATNQYQQQQQQHQRRGHRLSAEIRNCWLWICLSR